VTEWKTAEADFLTEFVVGAPAASGVHPGRHRRQRRRAAAWRRGSEPPTWEKRSRTDAGGAHIARYTASAQSGGDPL